jgi:hypothetical protein
MREIPNHDDLPIDAEQIFRHSGVGLRQGEAMGDEDMEYLERLEMMIGDAADFEESFLSTQREENIAYYVGYQPALPAGDEGTERPSANRSTFVSTDVRDTIMTMLPSLIRIFMSSERIANFVPTSEEHQEDADTAYDYCNYVFFSDNEGFLMLHGVLKDAMTVRGGITKWYVDNSFETTEQEYQNITPEQYQFLLSEWEEDVEVVEFEQSREEVIDRIVCRYVKSKPIIRVEPIPPEEFRISKTAKSVKSSPLVGHEYIATRSDLLKKGVPEEAIDEVGTSNMMVYSDERYMRNPALVDEGGILTKGILTGEWYVRLDKDGDGIDELRFIRTLGGSHMIVEDRPVSHVEMALWSIDPTPHTAFGDDIAELTKDIQRIKTNMIRGQLDNLAETINPRTVVNELVTNIEDVLSDEVGNIIRTRGDPNAAVAYTRPIYAGAEVQESINYLDQVRASRSGITEASKGLDPKAMQSTALAGIDAIVSGAQERTELAARILAATGFKDTIEGILRLVSTHQNHARTIKLRGKWSTVNPSLWDPNMVLEVNPTMGKGSDMIRLQALADIRTVQTEIIGKFGIANPIVTPQHFLNTVQDMLEIANLKNFQRYFGPITPELQQSIETAPKEPSPEEIIAQSEMEKNKVQTLKIIGETDKNAADTAIKQKQLAMDDDFRRDKLTIDSLLEIAAMFGQQVSELQSSEGVMALNKPPEA